VIDFSAVHCGELKLAHLAAEMRVHDLIAATNEQIDAFVALVRDLSDTEITFVASDPQGESGVGWNVAHVVAHMTASSEEGATVSSILARGIIYPLEPRLRVEVDWSTLTTTAACLQRLEESRRVQVAYLHAWPDHPRLDTYRTLPDAFVARFGMVNAISSCLLGLMHGEGHRVQLQEIIAQARNSG